MEEQIKIKNFIEEAVETDLAKSGLTVKTRFPPEPNGYLHIGHAKALCVDFGIADQYGGTCNLRFDDTNPAAEDEEYVDAIMQDIRWLGFEWDQLLFGSSYFDACFDLAVKLIKKGVAYVDELTKDEMREYRGTLTTPGRNSPWRDRSVEENLDLFLRMRAGEFPNGAKTLRAKIDMASPNINLRDPAMYRILHMPHHQTGDAWCIYPMYDFAHPIQDALQGITHSLCSLEYEIHRPLYDWVTEQCEFDPKPRQIEFARLNLTNTVMSKRYLRRLVEEGRVSGWDDPRMPTLCGMRRRGYTAAAIRDFLTRVGVAKADSTVDHRMLEHCVREELNLTAPRATAITEPLKLIITNWDEQTVGRGLHPPQQVCELVGGPGAPAADDVLPFSRELYIEKSDFSINPPPKFFRLKPDGEVRLRGAYIIQCESWDTDENGEVTCVYATYDPETRSGQCERKVKGTLHWLPVAEAVPATFRHFEPLILDETEGEGDFVDRLNPNSQVALQGFVEPALTAAKTGENFQFIRMGYYCPDLDSTPDKLIFNRTVALKDSFRIINNKE